MFGLQTDGMGGTVGKCGRGAGRSMGSQSPRILRCFIVPRVTRLHTLVWYFYRLAKRSPHLFASNSNLLRLKLPRFLKLAECLMQFFSLHFQKCE